MGTLCPARMNRSTMSSSSRAWASAAPAIFLFALDSFTWRLLAISEQPERPLSGRALPGPAQSPTANCLADPCPEDVLHVGFFSI